MMSGYKVKKAAGFSSAVTLLESLIESVETTRGTLLETLLESAQSR